MKKSAPHVSAFPRSLSPQALSGERESGTPGISWIPACARDAAPDLIGGGMTAVSMGHITETGQPSGASRPLEGCRRYLLMVVLPDRYSVAPAFLRICTISSSLLLNAIIVAVTPLFVLAFTSAPFAISSSTTARWPS